MAALNIRANYFFRSTAARRVRSSVSSIVAILILAPAIGAGAELGCEASRRSVTLPFGTTERCSDELTAISIARENEVFAISETLFLRRHCPANHGSRERGAIASPPCRSPYVSS